MPSTLAGDWSPRNRHLLETLLRTTGPGNYAVFDWDNTCVFLDVEEATLIYQLEEMAFAAEPDQMAAALRQQLPHDDEAVTAHLFDLDQAYRWLWPRYNSLLGRGRREAIQGSPEQHAFRAKFLHLYSHLEHHHGPEIAYPWMPFRFAGMTAQQVQGVTKAAVRWQLGQPIETVTWSCPDKGKAGAVEISWRNGLRLLPEMQSLHRALAAAGIDVWVCTASFVEGIRELASNPEFGYGLNPECVIGLRLASDENACYLAQREGKSEITYANGKTDAIRRLLLPRYGRGPILVAGDSNGDAPMLRDFKDTRLGLVIDTDRPRESPIGKLAELARQGHHRYLLQQRDEARGSWRAF